MPPRSLSIQSAVSVLDWNDNDPYVSTHHDAKDAANGAIAPLTKRVHWPEDDDHELFLIPHLDEFTDEEVADIWFAPDEYADMKNEYKETVFLIEMGKALDEAEHHTARGLEYRTQEGAWARYENKRDAYNAVLDEQDNQWKEDCDDEEALRRVYLEHSTKCAANAAKLAQEDAREAQAILNESPAPVSVADKPKKRGLRRMFSGRK